MVEINSGRMSEAAPRTFLLAFKLIPLGAIPLAVFSVPSFLLFFVTFVPFFVVSLMPRFLIACAFVWHG